MEVVKGSKIFDEAETSHQDENMGKPQVDYLEHVVGHDRDVYMEDDQAVDNVSMMTLSRCWNYVSLIMLVNQRSVEFQLFR